MAWLWSFGGVISGSSESPMEPRNAKIECLDRDTLRGIAGSYKCIGMSGHALVVIRLQLTGLTENYVMIPSQF